MSHGDDSVSSKTGAVFLSLHLVKGKSSTIYFKFSSPIARLQTVASRFHLLDRLKVDQSTASVDDSETSACGFFFFFFIHSPQWI